MSETVPVTQADRDAAADCLDVMSAGSCEFNINVRGGARDMHVLVQTLAAHRIASQTASPTGDYGELIERLRADDADWQEKCDGWVKEARARGGEVTAEQEVVLRRTLSGQAADALSELQGRVEVEREACAKLVEEWNGGTADGDTYLIAEAIRARTALTPEPSHDQ